MPALPAPEREMTYFRDTAALARKDLLLELRAKETLPSMLLFVVAALTIFHFALPKGTGDVAARGLLWSAIIFTALLGLTRAFVAEREQGMFDALVLAPCDRSAIWLGKTIAVLAFLVAAEVVALPAFAAFFSAGGRPHHRSGRPRRHRHRRRRDALRRDGGRRPRARADPAAPLPAARDSDRRRRGRRKRRRSAGATWASWCSTTRASSCSLGVVRVCRLGNLEDYHSLVKLAGADVGLVLGAAIALIFFYAPTDADQGSRRRIFYFHVPIALTSYACFGWGAWKALLYSGTGDQRADLESYVAIHQGVIFGFAHARDRRALGEDLVGRLVVWSENELVLFLVLFLFYCAYFMLRFSVDRGRRAPT